MKTDSKTSTRAALALLLGVTLPSVVAWLATGKTNKVALGVGLGSTVLASLITFLNKIKDTMENTRER